MSDLKKAAEMALEAWDNWAPAEPIDLENKIEALRQALAQEPSKQFHDWAVAEHQKALALAQTEQEAIKQAYLDGVNSGIKAEREACAKVCEEQQFPVIEDETCEPYNMGCRHSADAIRARGEK